MNTVLSKTLEANEFSMCRLCGNPNQKGSYLFSEKHSPNLSHLINKYLPIKVENNGRYPDKICPGCEIQLEATKLFFDLIIDGQKQLKTVYEKLEKAEIPQLDNLQQISNKFGTFEIQSNGGEKYYIQIINTDPNIYPVDHEMVTSMNILNKEKKRRGRPKKQVTDKDKLEVAEAIEVNEEVPTTEKLINCDGKRQRKIPARFSETVQGKELDDILRKEGIGEEDYGSDNSEMVVVKEEEVIGRIESQNGDELGEPVIITKVLNLNKKQVGIKTRKKRRKYRCEKCSEEFRNYPRLRIHMAKYHKDDDTEIADESNGTRAMMKNDSAVSEESQSINENKQLTESSPKVCYDPECTEKSEGISQSLNCNQCDKVFSCKQNLNLHIEGIHQNKKPFSCTECKLSFPYAKTLKIHQLKHKQGLYTCEICQKNFNHPSSLVYHRNAEHNNGKRFACNKCNKTFKHRQLLHRHQLVHTEDRPFKCELCTSAFKTRANLLSHNAIHTGEKNYTCTECGQNFTHKTSLNLHMRWHLGEKPFTCEVCSKSFSQKGNLLEHQRIHTGEKPFCCEMCGRNFTTSSQLKLHKKRHTGERPWRCEFCPKGFLYKVSWREHSRRHLNDRPFKCHMCSKSFTTSLCLKKHLRYHTGDKPHICDICLRGFADASNLMKHRKIHEGKLGHENETRVPVLNTDGDGLFYVYYEGAKEQNVQVPVVELEHAQSEEIVTSEHVESLSFKDNCMQFQQLVDQEGNPLSLNTQDGQQINVISSITTNGEEKLQGLFPDGTLVSIDLQDSKVETMERLVDHVEEEASVSHLLLDSNMTFLADDLKSQENMLVTKDPNICFVSYDPSTVNIIE